MLFVAMAGAGALVTATMIWTLLVSASLLRKINRYSLTCGSDSAGQLDVPEVRATAIPPRQNDGRGFARAKSTSR